MRKIINQLLLSIAVVITLVLYATEEERALYRTHANVDKVYDYIEWLEKYTLQNH